MPEMLDMEALRRGAQPLNSGYAEKMANAVTKVFDVSDKKMKRLLFKN